MATVISYLTEAHGLLPVQHFGGRSGRSAEDAMMILSESVYKAWKDKNVYTAIFMDVAGAFNNVHHKRLIHNLRMRHMPEKLPDQYKAFYRKEAHNYNSMVPSQEEYPRRLVYRRDLRYLHYSACITMQIPWT